jgi:universal stress protein A
MDTVICPVDFSSLSRRELDLAAEVCQVFGARLVLLHNLAAVHEDWAKAWEWKKSNGRSERSEAEAQEELENLLSELPDTVRAEGVITRGPAGQVLLHLARELQADLLVLGSHGRSTEDHFSLTERILEDCCCPVLAIEEGRSEHHRFHLRRDQGPEILVATDLTESGNKAVAYAFSLARSLPARVHLLHIWEASGFTALPIDAVAPRTEEPNSGLTQALARVRELIPPDLDSQVETHVLPGRAAEGILEAARELDPEILLMGAHARGLLRRFFTRDNSRELLHRAPCPVWFVPPEAAA